MARRRHYGLAYLRRMPSDLFSLLTISIQHVYYGLQRGHPSPLERRIELSWYEWSPTGPPRRRGRAASDEPGDRKAQILLLSEDSAKQIRPILKASGTDSPAGDRRLDIFQVPVEIQLLLIDHLNFLDIRSLRQTCKYFYSLYNPMTITHRFQGSLPFRDELYRYCRVCHYYSSDISHAEREWFPNNHMLFPALCWQCRPGRYTCKWCACDIGPEAVIRDFHSRCFKRYICVLWVFFILGLCQAALLFGGLVLAWRDYKDVRTVTGPITTSFIMALPRYIVLFLRSSVEWTFHKSLRIEAVMTLLWISPVYYVTHKWLESDHTVDQKVCFAFFWANFGFHLLNSIGYRLLMLGNTANSHHVPGHAFPRKLVHWIVLLMMCWTCPQAIEVSSPPPLERTFLGALGRWPRRIAANLADRIVSNSHG